jgi:hypothetical protein
MLVKASLHHQWSSPSRFILAEQIVATCRVSLVQLVRFLVVELTHLGSNPKFDMSIVFAINYSFSEATSPLTTMRS